MNHTSQQHGRYGWNGAEDPSAVAPSSPSAARFSLGGYAVKKIPLRLATQQSEVERHLYLAGLIQGREDAVAGRPHKLRRFVGSDSALKRGYIQGYNGWVVALRNEARP